jgi:hypothetical protein
MSKATPGPWYANGNGVHIQRGTVGLCVATAHDPHDPSHSTDVCHANARLIAASPLLLELANEVAKEYEDAADWMDAIGRLQGMARAALAKAGIP